MMSYRDHTASHYDSSPVKRQLMPFKPKYPPPPVLEHPQPREAFSQFPGTLITKSQTLALCVISILILAGRKIYLLITTALYKAIGSVVLSLGVCCFRRNVMVHCETVKHKYREKI